MKIIRALLFSLLPALVVLQEVPRASGAELDLVDGITVVVHDSLVTEFDVTSMSLDAYRNLGRQYAGPELLRKVAQVRHDNTEQLVNRQLILHEFNTAGYSLPESVIDELVRTRVREFGDEATLTRTLQAKGITKEKFRQEIRDQFILRAMREKNVASEIIISPHKMQLYYEQHTNDFKESDKVKVSMIMLNKPSEDEAAQVRGRAGEILTRLREGANFAELAKLYSQDSFRNQGGEHGWIEQKILGKELADACSNLKPGQTSEVVETKEACWIILMEEKTPAHVKPLNEVRAQIEGNLKQDEQKRLEAQWIERLKKKTYVKTF